VKKNKKYTDDFKRRAVARMANGVKATVICKDMKITSGQLYTWRAKFAASVKGGGMVKPHKAVNGNGLGAMKEVHVILLEARRAAVRAVAKEPERFDDPVYGLVTAALRRLEGGGA
jgi:transposase-like protein